MWNELGISGGTAIVILVALYFVIKWAVKNGVKEAYQDTEYEAVPSGRTIQCSNHNTALLSKQSQP